MQSRVQARLVIVGCEGAFFNKIAGGGRCIKANLCPSSTPVASELSKTFNERTAPKFKQG